MKRNELFQRARDKYDEAKALLADDSGDYEKADDLMSEAKELERRAKAMQAADNFDWEPEPDPDPDDVEKKGVEEVKAMLSEHFEPGQVDAWLKILKGEAGNFSTGKSNGDPNRSLGDFLKAVRHDDCKTLNQVYKATYESDAFKDLEEGSGTSGGYLVPSEEYDELFSVEEGEVVVRPRARKIPMRSRTLTIPKLEQGDTPAAYWKLQYFGGVLSYWTAEGGAKTETEPSFGQMELTAHKLAGHTQASDELLADNAVGLEALLKDQFRGAVNMREDFAFLRGSGVGMPLGILNAGCLLTQSRNTSSEVNYVDIANMLGQFLPSSFGNAVWVVSLLALPQLLQMEDTAGNNVFIPNASGGITQSIPGTMLGRPVIVTEKLPNLGSEGDVLLADFNYYAIGDRQATTIASSEHYAFINDLTTWRFVHRVDGQPWLDSAIYIDASNQVSPFVALAA